MQRAILHAAGELTCGGLSGANRQEGGMGMKKFTKRFSFLLLTVMMVLGFPDTCPVASFVCVFLLLCHFHGSESHTN